MIGERRDTVNHFPDWPKIDPHHRCLLVWPTLEFIEPVDGAAVMVICGEEHLKRQNAKPMGRIVTWAYGGVEPEIMGIGPVPATRQALERAGLKLSDIDVI